ncbi:MAG: hypothetical protein QM756_44205 [Polyangiaceae bacterium]
MVVGTVTERVLGRGRLKLERWARTLTRAGASLIGTFDVSELLGAVESRFPGARHPQLLRGALSGGPGALAALELALGL